MKKSALFPCGNAALAQAEIRARCHLKSGSATRDQYLSQ
jgi:hypothetical protein